jgi:hypothetical protein
LKKQHKNRKSNQTKEDRADQKFQDKGKKGLTKVNGVTMPQASKKVQQELRGKRFAEITTEEKRFQSAKKKAQDMLLKVTDPSFLETLDAIAKFVEKRKAIKTSQG